jgi:methyl-accepting chemotaxis protein
MYKIICGDRIRIRLHRLVRVNQKKGGIIMRISVGKKIGIGFGIMITFILVLGISCYISLQDAKVRITEIRIADQRSQLATASALAQREALASTRGIFAYGREVFYQEAEKANNDMLEIQKQLLEATSPEKKADVEKLIEVTTMQRDLVINESLPAARAMAKETAAGNIEGAKIWRAEVARIGVRGLPLSTQITQLTDEIKAYNDELGRKSTEAAIAAANQVIMIATFLSLISILIGIILGSRITRGIHNPIQVMLAGTKQFAAGDWREAIVVSSSDELGELADAINTMREKMRCMIRDILTSSEQVAASSEELTACAEQSAQAANQVALVVSDVAKGAEQQLFAMNESTEAIEQMSANIQQVAEYTQIAFQSSEQTAIAAGNGTQAIATAISQMTRVENTVERSANVIKKLGERSLEIGQIVGTISGIAAQTNLLALNAAIEAARAGEQGRGFAVVAEEVRKLAEQSQDAAKEIAKLIGEIQDETGKAVDAMHMGTEEVKKGTSVVNTAGTAFSEIVVSINQVSAQTQETSLTVQQMVGGSQRVVASVKEIDTISRDTAGQTQNISAATEEQSASMEEIASSSRALAKLAENLQCAVNTFKV